MPATMGVPGTGWKMCATDARIPGIDARTSATGGRMCGITGKMSLTGVKIGGIVEKIGWTVRRTAGSIGANIGSTLGSTESNCRNVVEAPMVLVCERIEASETMDEERDVGQWVEAGNAAVLARTAQRPGGVAALEAAVGVGKPHSSRISGWRRSL